MPSLTLGFSEHMKRKPGNLRRRPGATIKASEPVPELQAQPEQRT